MLFIRALLKHKPFFLVISALLTAVFFSLTTLQTNAYAAMSTDDWMRSHNPMSEDKVFESSGKEPSPGSMISQLFGTAITTDSSGVGLSGTWACGKNADTRYQVPIENFAMLLTTDNITSDEAVSAVFPGKKAKDLNAAAKKIVTTTIITEPVEIGNDNRSRCDFVADLMKKNGLIVDSVEQSRADLASIIATECGPVWTDTSMDGADAISYYNVLLMSYSENDWKNKVVKPYEMNNAVDRCPEVSAASKIKTLTPEKLKNELKEACKNKDAMLAKIDSLSNIQIAKAYSKIKDGKSCKEAVDFASTDGGAANPSDDDNQTSCAIDGIGWIICPVMNFMAEANEKAFGFLQNLLGIRPALTTDEGTRKAWSAFRDIANVAFVIAFLVIIYSQITSVGISNYGIKKLLPKIAVAAILVNLSLFVCQILVDVSNIAGASLYSFISGLVEPLKGTEFNESSAWSSLMGGVLIAGVGVLLIAMVAIAPTVLLALGLILLILVARQAFILILIIISPLAFVAYLLPNTESMFKKWWKALSATLLVYPIIAIVFGASTLASNILMGIASGEGKVGVGDMNDDNQMLAIVALAVMALPLFAVPVILKSAMSGAGKIGATLANWQDRANKRASGDVKDRTGKELKSARDSIGSRMLTSTSRRGRTAAFLTGTRRRANREARYKDNEAIRGAAEETFLHTEGSKSAARKGKVVGAQETANLSKEIIQNQAKQRHLDNNHDLHGKATSSGLDLHNAEETHKNIVGASHMVNNPNQYDSLNASRGVKQNTELETNRRFEGSNTGQALGVQRSGLEDQVATEKARQTEAYKTSTDGRANVQARKEVEGRVNTVDKTAELVYQQSDTGQDSSQRLKQVEGELNIAQGEQDVTFKNSDPGVDIAIRQDAVKQGAATADSFAETAATIVNRGVHLEAQAAKDNLSATQAGEEALVQELRTEEGAAKANPLYAGVASELQAADIEKRVQTQRTSAAAGIATVEYAKEVGKSAGVAGGLAEVAGGIDKHGAARAVAAATQVEIEQFGKNVAMEQSTMSGMAAGHHEAGKDLMKVVQDPNQSDERRAAAAGMIMKNGAMSDIHKLLDVSQALGTDEAAQGIRQVMMSDKNRTPFGLSSGDEAALKRGEPLVDGSGVLKKYDTMVDDRAKKKLSDAKWASLDPDDQTALATLATSGRLTGSSLQNLVDATYEAKTNENVSTTSEAKQHTEAILAYAAAIGVTPTP